VNDIDDESKPRPPRTLLSHEIAQAGAAAGRAAAAWWQQDTLGGHATGDTITRAATILRGLDDIDPSVLDALPTAPADLAAIYEDATAPDAPAWGALDPTDREALHDTYCDAFDAAIHDEVIRYCLDLTTDEPRGDR
jgi:hypothetical protein